MRDPQVRPGDWLVVRFLLAANVTILGSVTAVIWGNILADFAVISGTLLMATALRSSSRQRERKEGSMTRPVRPRVG